MSDAKHAPTQQALTMLRDYVAFHAPHGSECSSRIPYVPQRGFQRRECDCPLRVAKENAEIVCDSHDALVTENGALERREEAALNIATVRTEEHIVFQKQRDALVAAVTECLDAFVQWDILPADRCRSLRTMLRAVLKAAKAAP